MDKFKGKYRIPPTRATWWDYGWDGSYFITINTKDREHFFGAVVNDKMELSEAGKIADTHWRNLPLHAKNIELGPHVVMPNHVHGILNLKGNARPFHFVPFIDPFVETREALSLQKTIGQMRFRNPGKNTISTIIGGYKSVVSKYAHLAGFDFEWQSRFHDHLIRSKEEYERISEYIINNPARWKQDKFYSPPDKNL